MGSIYFNGQSVIRPQAVGAINANGLTPLLPGAARTVMIFGLAVKGTPKKVYTLSNPADALAIFGSGGLLVAAQRAWSPSPNQPGASTIKMVRVDPATQGALTLASSAPANLMTITSVDYGAYISNVTDGIYITVASGTSTGKKITITQGISTEVYDNLVTVAAAVAAINALSVLATATFTLEGTLANISATVLAGGTTGIASNTDWTNAFATALSNPANYYVPVTTDAAVHALLAAVVKTTCTQNKMGGQMYYGHAAGESAAAVAARVTTLNGVTGSDPSRNVLSTPGSMQYNAAGAIVGDGGSMYIAAAMAGMKAGMPLEEPLTFKYLSALGLETYWTPSDLDFFDQSGVSAVSFVPNKGYRISHGQTNWLSDFNVLYREVSVRDIADQIMSDVVADLEAFVGRPGSTATIASMRIKVASRLDLEVLQGYLTAGVDSQGNPQPAYQAIQLTFNSGTGICAVSFQCSPVTPINYVLVTGYFKATNIAA